VGLWVCVGVGRLVSVGVGVGRLVSGGAGMGMGVGLWVWVWVCMQVWVVEGWQCVLAGTMLGVGG
jgi:hypothetical protein